MKFLLFSMNFGSLNDFLKKIFNRRKSEKQNQPWPALWPKASTSSGWQPAGLGRIHWLSGLYAGAHPNSRNRPSRSGRVAYRACTHGVVAGVDLAS
jgi:hypothetical protein